MNKEAQRIAIAEACGWKWDNEHVWNPNHNRLWPLERMVQTYDCAALEDHLLNLIPDYLHDQNAIHEAKKLLTPAQRDRYACFLGAITGGRRIDYGATRVEATTEVLFADAAQQCEAFLRAINGWTEDETKS